MAKEATFNVKQLKTNFLAKARPRIRKKEKGDNKFANDDGYWNDGACNWGGTHRLDDDCQTLADFFNSIVDIDDDIDEIKLSANEQIFHQNKQALINKIENLVKRCQITSATSLANICIIWNDFFGICLERFLKTFTRKLTRNLKAIEKIEPKHQQELLDLEAQAREAKREYEENLRKANDDAFSDSERAQFVVLANKVAKKAEEIKRKIKHNPLIQIGQFNYLDDLKILSEGDVPENVTPDKKSALGDELDIFLPSDDSIPSFLDEPQEFLTKYRKEVFFFIVVLALVVFFYLQRDNDDEEVKEDKKFMRQMKMFKAMKDKE